MRSLVVSRLLKLADRFEKAALEVNHKKLLEHIRMSMENNLKSANYSYYIKRVSAPYLDGQDDSWNFKIEVLPIYDKWNDEDDENNSEIEKEIWNNCYFLLEGRFGLPTHSNPFSDANWELDNSDTSIFLFSNLDTSTDAYIKVSVRTISSYA